jgi:tetratricopeptide (TPR) repeat protein
MSKINWIERLSWTDEHIEDLRYTGFSYIRQGKYDIALSFFEALVILNPQDIYDNQTLGAIYLQLNEPLKAMHYFDIALKIDPEDGATLLNLAKAFFMLEKKEEGLKICQIIKSNQDSYISNVAKALLLAYS